MKAMNRRKFLKGSLLGGLRPRYSAGAKMLQLLHLLAATRTPWAFLLT